MALSKLQSVPHSVYSTYSLGQSGFPPDSDTHGTPDQKVEITLRGWSGNVMFFELKNLALTGSDAFLNNDDSEIVVDVTDNTYNGESRTYWSVDMGSGNGSGDEWGLTVKVKRNGSNTGKWVFTKGKSEDKR